MRRRMCADIDKTAERQHNGCASKSKLGLGGPNRRRIAAETVDCGFFIG